IKGTIGQVTSQGKIHVTRTGRRLADRQIASQDGSTPGHDLAVILQGERKNEIDGMIPRTLRKIGEDNPVISEGIVRRSVGKITGETKIIALSVDERKSSGHDLLIGLD